MSAALPALRLRPARADDAAACLAIYAPQVLTGSATFEEIPPDLAEMARRIAEVQGRDLPWLVAVVDAADGELVVGYAYAAPFRQRSAYRFTLEDSIYVAADRGGQGIGRRLLSALIEICADKGYRQMIAVIGDAGNQASIGLHQGLGFRMIGTLERTGFKLGRWIDTVLMQRSLRD